MSVFNCTYEATITDKNSGRKQTLKSNDVLAVGGPRVSLRVGIKDPTIDEFLAPADYINKSFVNCIGIIDTGAENSCIDMKLAEKLKLPIAYETYINTPSQEGHKTNAYYGAIIQIIGEENVTFMPKDILGSSLSKSGIGILLGRDFLSLFTTAQLAMSHFPRAKKK